MGLLTNECLLLCESRFWYLLSIPPGMTFSLLCAFNVYETVAERSLMWHKLNKVVFFFHSFGFRNVFVGNIRTFNNWAKSSVFPIYSEFYSVLGLQSSLRIWWKSDTVPGKRHINKMLTYRVKSLWLNLEDFLNSSNLIFSQLISHLWFMNEGTVWSSKMRLTNIKVLVCNASV